MDKRRTYGNQTSRGSKREAGVKGVIIDFGLAMSKLL
jgi:hypothetical protein